MNDIDIYLAQTNLSLTIQKLRLSINDIIEKHPTRTDLIDSMEKTIKDLIEAKVTFMSLEKNYRSAKENCFDYAFIISTIQKENEELKKQNNELKELL